MHAVIRLYCCFTGPTDPQICRIKNDVLNIQLCQLHVQNNRTRIHEHRLRLKLLLNLEEISKKNEQPDARAAAVYKV